MAHFSLISPHKNGTFRKSVAGPGIAGAADTKLDPPSDGTIRNVEEIWRRRQYGSRTSDTLKCLRRLLRNQTLIQHKLCRLRRQRNSIAEHLPAAAELDRAMDLIIIAAGLAGGDEHNIEPGFKKLAELKDRVVTLGENPNQSPSCSAPVSLDMGGAPVRSGLLPEADPRSSLQPGCHVRLHEEGFTDLMLSVMPKNRRAIPT